MLVPLVVLAPALAACTLVRIHGRSTPPASNTAPATTAATDAASGPPARSSWSEVHNAWHNYKLQHGALVANMQIAITLGPNETRVEPEVLPALENIAKQAHTLDALADECTREPLASGRKKQGVGVDVGDFCEFARAHRERLTAAVELVGTIAIGAETRRYGHQLDAGREGSVGLTTLGDVLFGADRSRPILERAYAIVNTPVPPGAATAVAAARRKVDATLAERARSRRPPAGHDATAHALVRAALRAATIAEPARFSVTRTWFTDDGWAVDQNDRGAIFGRYRHTTSLLKIAGKPYCLVANGTVTQDHMGGGRYGASRGSISMTAVWPASCK